MIKRLKLTLVLKAVSPVLPQNSDEDFPLQPWPIDILIHSQHS